MKEIEDIKLKMCLSCDNSNCDLMAKDFKKEEFSAEIDCSYFEAIDKAVEIKDKEISNLKKEFVEELEGMDIYYNFVPNSVSESNTIKKINTKFTEIRTGLNKKKAELINKYK